MTLRFNTKLKWLSVFVLLSACVDPIAFDVPATKPQLVVDGMISDQPGPYTVKISRTFSTDKPAFSNDPETGAIVLLFADEFFLDQLTETSPGVYRTTGVQGIVGKTYYITIETADNKRFVSTPEMMRPVGEVVSIDHEFEAKTNKTADGDVNADHFNIYVNGRPSIDRESFVRWRFTGTYMIRTQPEYAFNIGQNGQKFPTPPECSGVRVNGTALERFAPCSCCDCWITEPEKLWHVGDHRDVTDDGFKNVFVGEVRVNNETFFDKYHVQVDQMSASANAYEFFRLLSAQTEGVGSLFQPSTGDIKGNITAIDSDDKVLGIFWATSIKSKSIDILKSDIPYVIPERTDTVRTPCTARIGSSNKRPAFW
jgi:Domain of unknown function (DUF4249)